MIGLVVRGGYRQSMARAALRYHACRPPICCFLLSIRRAGERTGASRTSRNHDKANDVQRRMLRSGGFAVLRSQQLVDPAALTVGF